MSDLGESTTGTFGKADERPLKGVGLCLSGGGYRAMLFHLGALWRLNELAFLAKLDRLSTVSGGSITGAFLVHKWEELDFVDGVAENFGEVIGEPLHRMASRTIDWKATLAGVLMPGLTSSSFVARAYRRHLFGDWKLTDLAVSRPDGNPKGPPRLVVNATNLQSGVLWRFSRPYARDYLVGSLKDPPIAIADAVAASSAFPPFLSPAVLRPSQAEWDPHVPNEVKDRPDRLPRYRKKVVLSDGGVYDNLGLQTLKGCRTVLVSDGGGAFESRPTVAWNWLSHTRRVLAVIDRQVRALRKIALIHDYEKHDVLGTYWGIWTRIDEYNLADALPAPANDTDELGGIPTRLARMDPALQHRLVNWGYAICDAAMRRYVLDSDATPSPSFPYHGGVGR